MRYLQAQNICHIGTEHQCRASWENLKDRLDTKHFQTVKFSPHSIHADIPVTLALASAKLPHCYNIETRIRNLELVKTNNSYLALLAAVSKGIFQNSIVKLTFTSWIDIPDSNVEYHVYRRILHQLFWLTSKKMWVK